MKANRGIVGATYFEVGYDPAAQQPYVERARLSTKHAPVVYYMRLDRLVKIGWTTDLRRRATSIRPHGVLAVELGGPNIEERRHIEFAHLRSHHEWFWLDPSLAGHIVQVRADFEAHLEVTTEQWLEQNGVHSSPTINPGPAHV